MIGAHAVRHLVGAEQSGRLDDGALGMHPLGSIGLSQGLFTGKIARQDVHTMALPA